MKKEFEDFNPNIRRKIEGSNYDVEKGMELRPKTKLRAARLETMRDHLEDKTGEYSNQALLEYLVGLGWRKWKELHVEPEEEDSEILSER